LSGDSDLSRLDFLPSEMPGVEKGSGGGESGGGGGAALGRTEVLEGRAEAVRKAMRFAWSNYRCTYMLVLPAGASKRALRFTPTLKFPFCWWLYILCCSSFLTMIEAHAVTAPPQYVPVRCSFDFHLLVDRLFLFSFFLFGCCWGTTGSTPGDRTTSFPYRAAEGSNRKKKGGVEACPLSPPPFPLRARGLLHTKYQAEGVIESRSNVL
jgi:hypothetical protein